MDNDVKRAIPAFPTIVPAGFKYANHGMTLRDYFAAKAMQGLIANHTGYTWDEISFNAYYIADLMMEERDK